MGTFASSFPDLAYYPICVSDENECVDGAPCGENATCVNTVGSYACECEYGYTGDGHNCTRICPREYIIIYQKAMHTHARMHTCRLEEHKVSSQ